MSSHVLILGAGLAGLAAAVQLARRGFRVTVVEARDRLGGRAGSFTDPSTGQLTDNCQHVSMGCCTNFDDFCRAAGIAHLFRPQKALYFMTPDRRVSTLRADPLPAPLHLARSFLTAHYLTFGEKLRIARGLARLRQVPDDDPPFGEWLARHGQTPRTVARFWGLVLVSALNETADRIGLRYARKVFVDGFLHHRKGFEVHLPTVPLGRLYGDELQYVLRGHGAELLLGQAARNLEVENGAVTGVCLRDGTTLTADWYVSALPFARLLGLLPEGLIDAHPYFANLRRLETSPIIGVHLWYDRPITPLPHVVLIDCLGQWVFNRGPSAPGEHYLQVVISAARPLRGLGNEEITRRIDEEIRTLFPPAREAALLRSRVVTEHHATFSAVPGVDRWRPAQTSPIRNLFVAGDWTATGWPATMEGAVRSGYLAAQALLERVGKREVLLRPDL
jgi:squalene-associated FAD-dependent desaturase